MASAGDAKILLLDFTIPCLAGCVEIRLAAWERLRDQAGSVIMPVRPPEAPKSANFVSG